MTALAVFTTVANRDEARRIARAIVERRLAACAHLSARAIKELHSYELPAIHAVRIDHVSAPYLEWIAANSSGAIPRG
jgi:periplasmic divalent cation tolerance protein